MSNFCKVMPHPETGKIITESTNSPGFGTVRLDSTEMVVTNGFVNERKRSAFVKGKIETLRKMFTSLQVQGKIIRKTSSQPFYNGQEPVVNPTTGEATLRNGSVFYQQFEFTQVANATDVEIEVEVEEQVEA